MSRCGELNEGQSLLGRTKQRRSLLPPLSGSPPSPPGAPFDLANVSCLDAFFCSTQLPSSQFQRLWSMADPQVTTQAFDLIQKQRGTQAWPDRLLGVTERGLNDIVPSQCFTCHFLLLFSSKTSHQNLIHWKQI